ncbi:MAG TPA: hypothetical protein VFW89_09220 [Gemmatimonadaceae bacterium]|nr:hypothetical protein [Gemmatimonadaceae bacterium]
MAVLQVLRVARVLPAGALRVLPAGALPLASEPTSGTPPASDARRQS